MLDFNPDRQNFNKLELILFQIEQFFRFGDPISHRVFMLTEIFAGLFVISIKFYENF